MGAGLALDTAYLAKLLPPKIAQLHDSQCLLAIESTLPEGKALSRCNGHLVDRLRDERRGMAVAA